jgi:hypothetical protein
MKKIEYQPKQIRIFLALLLAFGIFLTFKLTRGAGQARIAIIAGEIVLIGALAAVPKLFFPVYRLIMIGSGYLGNFMFALISILVFFIILTPIALIMRLFGKKFMETRISPALPSYYDEGEEGHDITKQY